MYFLSRSYGNVERRSKTYVTYLRLEKRNSYIRPHGVQSILYFGSVPEVSDCRMELTAISIGIVNSTYVI